jgi:hypothetical protein
LTSDEIMHVLRLTAMSRVNHPEQQRLCEALAQVFAAVLPTPLEGGEVPPVVAGEKRRKKAD